MESSISTSRDSNSNSAPNLPLTHENTQNTQKHTNATAYARTMMDSNEFASIVEAEFRSSQKDDWEFSSVFDSLASCMSRGRYEWPILLSASSVLLGGADRINQTENGSNENAKKQQKGDNTIEESLDAHADGDEDDDDDDEPTEPQPSADSSPAASLDAINPSDLGPHQLRAFRYLQFCILRHLGLHPLTAAITPPADTFSLSSPASSPSIHSAAASPITVPRNGDVIGVWLVSLVSAARNRSVALSLLKVLELLGRVTSLRVTIQKCFMLLQRERLPEDADATANPISLDVDADASSSSGSPVSSESDELAKFISPHLASGFVTPSSFLPLHALAPRVIHRFRLESHLLRTLQVILGDGVMMPSVAALTNESDATRPPQPGPNMWYDFVDTPIFPRISGGAAPSANGYCWSAWVNVSTLGPASGRSSPAIGGQIGSHAFNVFRFFNDIGHGVQVFLKSNTLCARVLPNTAESHPLKNFLLHEHRWYFITIVHKPKSKPAPTTVFAPPITSNMANVTSFIGRNTSPAPSASFRPSAPGMPPTPIPPPQSAASPTSPSAPPRPANLYLYVDGMLVSTNDIPYPVIEHSESMQVSLGGYTGRMGAFHFFHDILSPSSIYSLYTLGGGMYSAPAHHIVNTGLVTVFPPSPSATALNITDMQQTPGTTKDEHGVNANAPNILNHRIVSRVLLSHSPGQSTHEFCLPYAWSDDWHVDHWKGGGGSHHDPSLLGTGCASHTFRLPGVGVHQRRNNSQWFVDIGGLKLLLQSLSPLYGGLASAHVTDEDVAEMLTLVAIVTQANPHNANQLLEIGAATFKQMIFEQLKKKHKTAVMINGLKHFLLVVSSIDHTTEQVHFASFVSYLLLDFTYWRSCSPHIQSLVVHLLKLLVLHNPRPFILHPNIGIARIIDSIRALTHRFFVPELHIGTINNHSAAQTPSILSPAPPTDETERTADQTNLQVDIDVSPNQALLNAYSPTGGNSPHLFSPSHQPSASSAEPTDSEMSLVRNLLSIAVSIAQQSVASPQYESHVLHPFLHLLQLSTVSASDFPQVLLEEFLQAFLAIIPISSHRTLTYLHAQGSAHVFVKLLYGDSTTVRVLALHCLQHVNYHLVRIGKLDRNKTAATNDSMYLQSDIATAVGSCLSLHTPISAEEHDALFELLMGQTPQPAEGAAVSVPHQDGPHSGSAAPSRTHRGMSLETGLAFCHSAYLSVILELALASSLAIQSKVLLDLLTLLRSNPHNVLVMASLFWQKLLLPFLSKVGPTPTAHATNANTHNNNNNTAAPEASSEDGTNDATADDGSSENETSDRDTIDVLVYQLLNLLLVHCMTNEPKGWQVLDQVLWCIDEAQRARMAAAMHQHLHAASEADLSSGTVSVQWRLQVVIFNRLFQSLQKSVLYLSLPAARFSGATPPGGATSGVSSSSGTVDGVATANSAFSLHSDSQIQNLRRNIPAVLELTEWLIFHSKESFLAPITREEMARRTSSNADRTESEDGGGVRKDSFPSTENPHAASAPPIEDNADATILDASIASVNPDMPPPFNPHSRLVSSVSRSSLRGLDEPLSEVEIEVLTGLLTNVVKNYPLPERRQDVLRIMFRYLTAVLPHPLCAALCPLICECVLHLFTERISEMNDKNNRLIALSLHLLKQAMEIFLRRDDVTAVEQCKVVMGSIFARCGPQVFQPADPTNPYTRNSVIFANANRGSITGGMLPMSVSHARVLKPAQASIAESNEEIDLMTGPDPTGDTDQPEESPLEQALFHLYNGEGKSIVESTQLVFSQHELRLGYVCEARARQVADSISVYLKKQQQVDSRREKTFSLQSMEVHKRVQKEKPFLLSVYQAKRNKIVFRRPPKDVKHAMKIHKLLKHYHYQHANSRPRPLLPALLPPQILSLLESPGAAFSPYSHAIDFSPSRLNYSGQLEFWKLDSTESPTRMRRIVKKNFRGSSHQAASQNAATGKTAILAPQALDLANSLKSAVVKTGASDHADADADALLAELSTPHPSVVGSSHSHAAPMLAPNLEQNDDDDDAADSGDDDDDDALDEDEEDDKGESKKRSKYLLTRDCVMITAERKYLGQIKIAQQHLVFTGTEIIRPEPAHSPVPADMHASKIKPRKAKDKFLRWPLKQIRMVLPRLYLLRESALEIFFNNFKNHFFNFTPVDEETNGISWNNNNDSKKGSTQSATTTSSSSASSTKQAQANKKLRSGNVQRNEIYKLLCSLCPDMQFELSPARRLLKSGITKKWQRGEISNFDYLQHLNTISGRSYNDINQYPVFPWILTDYKSDTIDLNDESIYRDLSKPIGALNEDRFEIYSERYQTFDDPEIPGFMYGSHYSSAGIALYYLLRLEPFTKLAISLQGNHFDLADRLFDSIAGAWDLSLNNVGDVKELIPEFFYLPDFLRNLNGLDLGTKQDKQKLNDVVLPPWAHGSPEEFIRIHRAALESEYVSEHLHEWIDLIFGSKQRGQAAIDAENVFFYLTYAGAVDIDAIDNPALRKATEDQIAHFGQTPAQLLTSPHPARFSAADRAKIASGTISLPAKLNDTYSSQLIHYYQPARRAAGSRRPSVKSKLQHSKTMPLQRGNATPPIEPSEPILSPTALALHGEPSHGHTFDADRTSILSQVPTMLCFASRDVIIGVTTEFGVQTHNLTPFLAQPPQLLPPDTNNAQTTMERSVDAEEAVTQTTMANERSDTGDSKEGDNDSSVVSTSASVSSSSLDPLSDPDLLTHPPPSATAALSAASSLLVSTLAQTPSLLRKQIVQLMPAQRVPPAVQSSHVIHPMCKHWFLDPAIKHNNDEKVTLRTTPPTNTADHLAIPPASHIASPVSPQSSVPASPSLSARSTTASVLSASSLTIHPCVTALALNGQFLFSGGYFDGSLKCHSIMHFKVDEPTTHAQAATTRTTTSPPVITASSAITMNASGNNRAHIQTRRTVDCKPLSTVQAHHAPITAICLAHNQSILFTGDGNGCFYVWRVFTERHERNRPPLSSAPLATFPVHEGRVLSIASNTYVGVAVSLAMDLQGQRGCELCVYSVRGGTARFIRSQLAADPDTDWQQVVLTSNANIVIYGTQAGVPMLFAYSLNGHLLKMLPTDEVINVLYATSAIAKTTSYDGFIVTGGRKSVIVFRSPHTLEPVQSFYCDELYPQSVCHEPSSAGGLSGAANAAEVPPVKDIWDGTSTDGNESNKNENPTEDKETDDAPASSSTAASAPAQAPSSVSASPSPDVAAAAAAAAHDDPILTSLVRDPSIDLRMGVAGFDISPSQHHFIVSMYPPPFPPVPSVDDATAQPTPCEGRLLLFPLPHSGGDVSQLGFYLDYGWNTLETVRDAMHARIHDGRDKLTEARDKWASTAGKATEKINQAKAKIMSAFTGFFGANKDKK